MKKLMFEFLNYLGDDVVSLYKEMFNNKSVIIYTIDHEMGSSINSIYVSSPCLVLSDYPNLFEYYTTFSHEMGHCYQYKLQKDDNHFETFNPYKETTSILFEKMFVEFLKNKGVCDNNVSYYEMDDHSFILNDMSICLVLSILFMENEISEIDPFDLSYQSSFTKEELRDEVSKCCGYIKPTKKNISLDTFSYSIGHIISTYFIDKMKNNFKEAWQEYKSFISTADNYSLLEVLDKYYDDNLINNNIKKFIKSYRVR